MEYFGQAITGSVQLLERLEHREHWTITSSPQAFFQDGETAPGQSVLTDEGVFIYDIVLAIENLSCRV